MEIIKVLEREFAPLIGADKIDQRVRALANEMNVRYASDKPVFLAILNGAFIFAADLLRQINFPHEISFVKISSYKGTQSSGESRQLIGINEDLRGRKVIILEDIVETGRTLVDLIAVLETHQPAGIVVATLLYKPLPGVNPPQLDHIGFQIEDRFVLGYGLDYDGYGRNLKDIYGEVEKEEL